MTEHMWKNKVKMATKIKPDETPKENMINQLENKDEKPSITGTQ